MQCGEQALLPAVRAAADSTLVIADGFSCKTQIHPSDVGRDALHVAQVMAMAREQGAQGYRDGLPEEPYYEARPKPPAGVGAARVGVALGVAGVAAALGSRAIAGTAHR